MQMKMRVNKEKIIGILDTILLIGLALHVFDLSISATTFMFRLPKEFMGVVLVILMAVAVIKAILMWGDRYMWMSIPVAAVYLVVCFRTSYEFMGFIAVFIVGFVGTSYRKILIAYLIPAAAVLFSSVFAALSGGIMNIVCIDGSVKSSWGSCYYTEFASALFFLLLISWVFLKNIPDVLFLLPGVVTLFVSLVIAGSRTATTLSVVFLAFIVYKILEDKYAFRESRYFWVQRVANGIVRFVLPVFMLFMILMVWLYQLSVPFALKYDTFSKNRLVSAAKMLDTYGVRAFGSLFDMAGNGWSSFKPLDYTFIDSSYLLILIRYGLVTALFITIIWVWMGDKGLRAHNRRMAFAMVLVALDAIGEQHFTELNYNIFLVMPFASMDEASGREDARLSDWLGNDLSRKFRSTQLLSLIVGGGIVIAFLPVFLSYFRTIFNGYGMTNGTVVIDGVLIFIISLVAILIFVSFIWCFSKLIANDALEKSINRKYLLLTIMLSIFIFLGFVVGDSMVDKVYRGLLGRIATETDIVGSITANATGKVYADRYPESYRKMFAGVHRSFYDGEDIARCKDVTVIVDAEDDFNVMSYKGFSYTKISDFDAIYTNDKGVKDFLEGKGYELSKVNNSEHVLDLRDRDNQVTGPALDLYGGDYVLAIDMTMIGEENVTGTVGTVRITSDWGKNAILEKEVTADMFGEEGMLSLDIPFLGGARGYEFSVSSNIGNALEVGKMTYRRLSFR